MTFSTGLAQQIAPGQEDDAALQEPIPPEGGHLVGMLFKLQVVNAHTARPLAISRN